MYYYLSKETCQQLKDWGCDVKSEYFTTDKLSKAAIRGYSELKGCTSSFDIENYLKSDFINIYDLRDIICDGETAKKFFAEGSTRLLVAPLSLCSYHDDVHIIGSNIMRYLQQNKKTEAEEYFLSNTIFNPNNK